MRALQVRRHGRAATGVGACVGQQSRPPPAHPTHPPTCLTHATHHPPARPPQHYTDLSDIKRVIVNTHAIEPQALTEYFGTLSGARATVETKSPPHHGCLSAGQAAVGCSAVGRSHPGWLPQALAPPCLLYLAPVPCLRARSRVGAGLPEGAAGDQHAAEPADRGQRGQGVHRAGARALERGGESSKRAPHSWMWQDVGSVLPALRCAALPGQRAPVQALHHAPAAPAAPTHPPHARS